jgi:hypothetical protein
LIRFVSTFQVVGTKVVVATVETGLVARTDADDAVVIVEEWRVTAPVCSTLQYHSTMEFRPRTRR